MHHNYIGDRECLRIRYQPPDYAEPCNKPTEQPCASNNTCGELSFKRGLSVKTTSLLNRLQEHNYYFCVNNLRYLTAWRV